jgi:ribosomal protein L40E
MSRENEEIAGPDSDDADARALDLQIAEYLKVAVPIATIAAAFAAGFLQGAPAVILVLAAGSLVTVIAVFWASIRTLVGETPLTGADAYALGSPRAEEEQKRAVLRALKDLEFERSVGKITQEDYDELVAKYRAEAKRLLRMLDEENAPGRTKVEDLVKKRLVQEGLAASSANPFRDAPKVVKQQQKKKKGKGKTEPIESEPARSDEAKEETASAAPAKSPVEEKSDAGESETKEKPAVRSCTSCGTKNDADAVFCKKCGARQVDEDETENDEEDAS